MKLLKQLSVILAVVLVFALFNVSMYKVFTVRLGNNFSDAGQLKMVDVKNFLPFSESSDLVKADTDFSLKDNLPVLDGAAALVPVYASVIHSLYPEGSVTFEGGVFSDDNYYGENFAPDSKMQYNNTVRGYKAVVDGDTDIFLSAAPSAEQKEYAGTKGVELTYVPIGLEAFVFFVNSKNPIENLTADQIREIYAGNIKNWKDVGGVNRIINPILRIPGSGSQSAMDNFMGDTPYGNKSLLSPTGGALGFSFRYYLDGMVDNSDVKMLSLNGIYPSPENIRNGTYPVIAQFYAIYRTDNKNENIPLIIDWLLSEEGQSLIESTGYVRIN